MNPITTSSDARSHSLAGVTVHVWSDAIWKPMVLSGEALPGFHWWPLTGDEQGAWEAYWRSRHFTHSPTGCHALVVTSRHAAVLRVGDQGP